MSGLIISFATDQSRRTRAQGGVHVTDRKTTPCEGRNDRRPRRPVEALARTCAAGRPGVHKHGSPPRRPQFYRNYGQRAASGADHAVHGLGRDQVQEAHARWLAHHRVPGLGPPIARTASETASWFCKKVSRRKDREMSTLISEEKPPQVFECLLDELSEIRTPRSEER